MFAAYYIIVKFLLQFFLYIVMVSFRAVAGNQFTEETGEEQQHSDDKGRKRKIEKRLVRHCPVRQAMCLLDKFFDDYPYGQDASYEEGQQTGESEEMHGLFPEGTQEPEGKQVEESVDEPFHPELAFPVFALLVVDRLFRDPVESGILCQIRYVPVHFSIHLYVLDDLVAVCLEPAVHVVEPYSGNFPCRRIVQLGREVLCDGVVLPVPLSSCTSPGFPQENPEGRRPW